MSKIKLFSSITNSVTITAFLILINYFSVTPSIEKAEFYQSELVNFLDIKNFYNDLDYDIPECINHRFNKYLKTSKDTLDYNLFIADNSDYNFLNSKDLTYINKFSQSRVKRIEKQFQRKTYIKQIWGWHGKDYEYIIMDSVGTEIFSLKSCLDNLEYYMFISAFLNSKWIKTSYIIKNNGSLDMENFVLYFQSPMSMIKEDRSGNIINLKWMSQDLLSYIERDSLSVKIEIPLLQVDESISFELTTRENMVKLEDINVKFDTKYRINYFYVFLFIVVVTLFNCTYNYYYSDRIS